MSEHFALVMCDAEGRPVTPFGPLHPTIVDYCAASAALFARLGYEPPSISYVAVSGSAPAVVGALVGPPSDGRVAIAYFTLADFEGRGIATLTARHLCAIAATAKPPPTIVAKTLPEPNASTRVLPRSGFAHVGEVHDDKPGTAWLWERVL
ncbi:GNAT family N-acetyltransferase [Elioraea rosea]|uniref:GNAT family N-acetyltransferase n=1 Tax=Elioraea rosea TaxID=2492390 RepID=UPI001183A74A|nr:GNAT family N-acetyltransferase [Elioraea rosea]